MKYRVLTRDGKWRHPHYLRMQVYAAWQRYEKMLDRKKAAFIKGKTGEASRYKERLARYQGRVCEGRTSCHEKVRVAYQFWEDTDLCQQSQKLEGFKDSLLSMIEDGSYTENSPRAFKAEIEEIANTIPYVRRCKCRK